ncbi:MAG TPA: zinc-binding dehydrogenase [Gaiellaceae bacterium]|nr:zinc-binding dehydrogenase [Gaiellaceae bacterium]
MRPRAPAVTTRAAVIAAPGCVELVDEPLREPAEDEVLVRIEGCGVCASSLPLWEGRAWFSYPLPTGAPGHEPWGVVEGGDPELVGRRVAFLSERGFAECAVVPREHVVPLPAGLGKPFPGEALASAVNVVRRARVQPGESVAIVGAGFIGSAAAQLLHAKLVRREDEPNEEFDVVVEAAGTQEALDKASRLVATRGRLVIAGYHQDGLRTVDLQSWNWRGLDVVNAHERDALVLVDALREAAQLVAAGELDVDALVTHRFPLERLADAFEAALERPAGFVKAWVAP